MSITLDDEQSQQIFLTLAESLEGGEPLPTGLLVTSLQHPEASIRRLAIEVIQLENDPAVIPALLRATLTRMWKSVCSRAKCYGRSRILPLSRLRLRVLLRKLVLLHW
jgi:hypothetical protein